MPVEPAPERPNIELRRGPTGKPIVMLAFPYDPQIVRYVRAIPQRHFEWERREWSAPADAWSGAQIQKILHRFPHLTTSTEVDIWLRGVAERWLARITTTADNDRGYWLIETVSGQIPDAVTAAAEQVDGGGKLLVPMTVAVAEVLDEQRGLRLDGAAARAISIALLDRPVPGAQIELHHDSEGTVFVLQTLWNREASSAFDRLCSDASGTLPLDPWLATKIDDFIVAHDVAVDATAEQALGHLRQEAAEAESAIAASRATEAEPIAAVADLLGGTLEPFQWAGVRYLLDVRHAFLADEQGLGKTVQALAALEAADTWPAIVVCPASLKLNWEREARRWLPNRSIAVIGPGVAVPEIAELSIINYEMIDRHHDTLARSNPRALIVDESHYIKNPRAKRTRVVRRLAESIPNDGLRLALSGTPVLNHPEELITQLRMLGRMQEFGSGASFKREFKGVFQEDRLHWHLRRHCFIRRLKSEVLPQLPAKRQVVVPIELNNEREYRLAERDIIAWLQEQPLDLKELDARIAATLRAERLAQLTALQRVAARGKLHAALAWIHDFLTSGEPLVVFCRHVEIQEAVVERFPDALHILGRDSIEQREAAVRSFQAADEATLIVCATRVAAQGITLTRASNVCFLEQEWTPALHEQAEDRCHRIGQHDAVTAWYLLAAETIDETMAGVLARKRGIIDAVTDGQVRTDDESVVEAVITTLRESPSYRHLRVTDSENN